MDVRDIGSFVLLTEDIAVAPGRDHITRRLFLRSFNFKTREQTHISDPGEDGCCDLVVVKLGRKRVLASSVL